MLSTCCSLAFSLLSVLCIYLCMHISINSYMATLFVFFRLRICRHRYLCVIDIHVYTICLLPNEQHRDPILEVVSKIRAQGTQTWANLLFWVILFILFSSTEIQFLSMKSLNQGIKWPKDRYNFAILNLDKYFSAMSFDLFIFFQRLHLGYVFISFIVSYTE